jgi:acetyl-CoA C-acetyltransferase
VIGPRIAAELINNLQVSEKELGLETMCAGGGQGRAMILERMS